MPALARPSARFDFLFACLLVLVGCDDGGNVAEQPLAGDAAVAASDSRPDAGPTHPGSVVNPATTGPTDGGSVLADGSAGLDAGLQVDARSAEAGSGAASEAGAPDAAVPAQSGACDRNCMAGYLDGYLKALVARDPSMAKFAASLRATENGRETKVGEGLWKSASSIREDTRFYFIDPEQGQAALHVVVLENQTTPVIYQARIKVVQAAITELETVAVRRQGAANGFFSPDGMVPQPAFKAPIAPEKRMKREALRSAVDVYLSFLEGKRDNLNFDAMCARYENGVRTATGNNIASQRWSFDVQRRYLVFDEEEGLVWGMFPFSAADTALVVGEVFKVVDGKLTMIQAVMANMPAKAWP